MIEYEFYELIILDALIYIDFYTEDNEKLGDIVEYLLRHNNLQILIDKMPSCLLQRNLDEWKKILGFIKKNERLRQLTLAGITNSLNNIRAVRFKNNENQYIVIFRGTTTSEEWIDNGKGAYLDETQEQKQGLEFIEETNGSDIIVSGHSKGGNIAQYTTILSNKIAYCVAVNSQGFSRKFVLKYDKKIKTNSKKIHCINCKYDYVNCLLKNISKNNIFINTEKQKNPLFYHKCEILLCDNGKLRTRGNRPFFNKIINDFSTSLLNDLPKDMQIIIFDSFMEGIKSAICKEKFSEHSLIKIIYSIFLVLLYGKYFKYKESALIFFSAVEMFVVPFLMWNDFIYCDETKDRNKYEKLISKIEFFENKHLKKFKVLNNFKLSINKKLETTINNLIKDLKKVDLKNFTEEHTY